MADSITRYLQKQGFVGSGKKGNRYIGVIDGKKRMVVFHYHKNSDLIKVGTFSSMARQLNIPKKELIELVKKRVKK